jgi:hypothetical protein
LVVQASPARAPQGSGRATTKHQVRDRADRLNDATQNPQRLGTPHLPTRPPGQVREGHGGQYHLNRRANEDGPSLTSAEVAPPLFGRHDRHATPNGSTRPTRQAACHRCSAAQVRGHRKPNVLRINCKLYTDRVTVGVRLRPQLERRWSGHLVGSRRRGWWPRRRRRRRVGSCPSRRS